MGHKADEELAENVDFLFLLPVVFVALFESKSKCLADDVVEWNCEEIATESK